jgi:hypothetical protein
LSSRDTKWVAQFLNSEIKQLSPLFFAMVWDIDLTFGMWVYNDKLQIMFTFHSGPMIFGWVMALEPWNFAKYLVVTTSFRYALRYWPEFWYMMSYRSSLHFVGTMIFGRVMALGLWNLAKYLVVTKNFRCAWRYWLDFFIFECILMSYRSCLHFVPIQWFLAELCPLDFEIWPNI